MTCIFHPIIGLPLPPTILVGVMTKENELMVLCDLKSEGVISSLSDRQETDPPPLMLTMID